MCIHWRVNRVLSENRYFSFRKTSFLARTRAMEGLIVQKHTDCVLVCVRLPISHVAVCDLKGTMQSGAFYIVKMANDLSETHTDQST